MEKEIQIGQVESNCSGKFVDDILQRLVLKYSIQNQIQDLHHQLTELVFTDLRKALF